MAIFDFKSIFSKKKETAPAQAKPTPVRTPSASAQGMPEPIRDIAAIFKGAELKHKVDRVDGMWVVLATINGEKAKIDLMFVVTDKNPKDVDVRVLGLAVCPEAKRGAMYKLLNDLNNRYRFVKFTMSNSGKINMEADLPQENTAYGDCALELMLRFSKIADDVYPQIMQAIWS